MADERLPPGTPVIWESQAHGSWKSKRGTVEAFVPAGKAVSEVWEPPKDFPRSRILIGNEVSRHDRYVVAVSERYGLVRYYAPIASVVEVARS